MYDGRDGNKKWVGVDFYYRINRGKLILGNKYNFQKLKHQKEINVYM